MLRDQTRRLVLFSDDISALAQAEEGQTISPVRVAASELISTAVATVADRYRAKEVALKTRVNANVPPLWADPQRLGQVLGNLLDNALRHTARRQRRGSRDSRRRSSHHFRHRHRRGYRKRAPAPRV